MMLPNFVPPGLARLAQGTLTTVIQRAFKPSDLYWTYQNYLLVCRGGNMIHCDDFWERDDRLEVIMRARRIMAQCVLIAMIYPEASWTESTPEE